MGSRLKNKRKKIYNQAKTRMMSHSLHLPNAIFSRAHLLKGHDSADRTGRRLHPTHDISCRF